MALCVLALFLSACTAHTSTGAPSALTPEVARAAELADLLVATARAEPERVRVAHAEMLALEQALMAPQGTGPRVPSPPINAPLGPPPDLAGARSVLSAVHLASYRDPVNVARGWAVLQEQASGALVGLEPRLVAVTLGDRGRFLRLKAGPLDTREAAIALCAQLEAQDIWCQPTDFDGQRP